MLTSKQRAKLRSLAQNIEPVTQAGKLGINEAFLEGLSAALEKRELVKVTVLENSGLNAKDAGIEIAEKLSAEFVAATGRKIILYRKSKSDKVVHIEI